MGRTTRIFIFLTVSISGTAPAQTTVDSKLKTLYDARQWVALNDALLKTSNAPPLYFGAVAVVFNQARRAEEILGSILRSAPKSQEAYEAHEWLAHEYFRTGRYHQLISTMEARWAAFPQKKEVRNEQTALAGFRDLPDQTIVKCKRSALSHKPGEIFIPLSIDGTRAEYFFDTGAWINSMSESEAKRLGLKIQSAGGTASTSTGVGVGFRTAVAKEVAVGGVRFSKVSFAIFQDDQEPWSVLPPGRRGLVGISLILGFGTLRWNQNGTFEIGSKPGRMNPSRANLFFEDDHLALGALVNGQSILATLDTGAETTDLYKPFAEAFPKLIRISGKKDKTEVRGVGHAEEFESITLPALTLRISQIDVALRPAHVLLSSIGAKCCVGNVGMDLLKQGRSFKIDFGAMKLDLEPSR